MTQKVVLYYPNNWKRYIGNLASPEEKKFNWFLCSKRYKDPKTGLFVAEIRNGTKFYEEDTGQTLVVPLSEKEGAVRLLIDDDSGTRVGEALLKAKEYGYQGIARLQQCNLKDKASDEFVVCKEAEFEFLPGVLEESRKEKFCPIIDFSKRNNKCIRSKIPDFPTPKEIDEVLENYKCSTVCRILYDYIYLYLSKL